MENGRDFGSSLDRSQAKPRTQASRPDFVSEIESAGGSGTRLLMIRLTPLSVFPNFHQNHFFYSLVPRPPYSFCRLQYEKRGRPGIFYHVNDVEGRERVERL